MAADFDVKVTHERTVVREAHVGHAKIRHLDSLAHQDEIELDARHARREGGQALGIGAAQPGGAHEKVDLVRAPEGIEVARHDHRLLRLHDEIMQRAQLVLALAKLQRQMHEEHAHILEFELDDEALDAGIEVMEALAAHVWRGQKRVRLLAHDRHELIEGARPYLHS